MFEILASTILGACLMALIVGIIEWRLLCREQRTRFVHYDTTSNPKRCEKCGQPILSYKCKP